LARGPARASLTIFNLDSSTAYRHEFAVEAVVALNEDAQVKHWPVTGLPVRIE
jgi:hypothetical protein